MDTENMKFTDFDKLGCLSITFCVLKIEFNELLYTNASAT